MPVCSSTSSGRSSPDSDQVPSRRCRLRAESRSCSSAMSPTISSTRSSSVTTPSVPPYSSTTTAICMPWSRSRVSSGSSSMLSGTVVAGSAISVSRTDAPPVRLDAHRLLDVHDAERRRRGPADDREPRVTGLAGRLDDVLRGVASLEEVHVHPRRADVGRGAVAERDAAGDQLGGLVVDGALLRPSAARASAARPASGPSAAPPAARRRAAAGSRWPGRSSARIGQAIAW